MIAVERDIISELRLHKYTFIPGSEFSIDPKLETAFQGFCKSWDQLETDQYLPEGGKFRFRRYDNFYFHPKNNELRLLPYRPFFQPEEDNDTTGGIYRHFAPLEKSTAANHFMHELIKFSFWQTPASKNTDLCNQTWEVDVHQIRVISNADETGNPTPEGIHRDGGNSGFIYMIKRENGKGAATFIYDNNRNQLEGFTLENPLDCLMFLDEEVLHSASKLFPQNPVSPAVRDVFLFGFHFKPELEPPK